MLPVVLFEGGGQSAFRLAIKINRLILVSP